MPRNSRITELDKVVIQELDDFAGACVRDIQEAAEEAAKWAAKELKNTSPKKFGYYARGWKVKREKLRTGTKTIVYNEGYQLTHLLEYGHPTGNGGRTQPHVHIKPVETAANQRFEQEVRRRIEDGT